MKCNICHKHIFKRDFDEEYFKTTGRYSHRFCVRAKSVISLKPYNIKHYEKIEIINPDEALSTNLIKIMPSGK